MTAGQRDKNKIREVEKERRRESRCFMKAKILGEGTVIVKAVGSFLRKKKEEKLPPKFCAVWS